MHWGINPPQKHHPLFLAKPPLNLQTVQVPSFLGNPPAILVFHETPPKNRIFQCIHLKNIKVVHLLKVTKFLVNISQFEFLLMTEKNIFTYQLFCH